MGDGLEITGDFSEAERARFTEVLEEAIEVVEGEEVDYAIGGSIAAMTWGRPTSIEDIDVILSPTDAPRVLKAFDRAGHDTEEPETWLYKAKKNDVTVDLIFEMESSMYLDEQMAAHTVLSEAFGVRLRLMSAEDYVISQALSTKEDTAAYWYNALSVLGKTDIDWDYLVERASRGPRRVLALLIYAESNDLAIPKTAVRRLFESVYGA